MGAGDQFNAARDNTNTVQLRLAEEPCRECLSQAAENGSAVVVRPKTFIEIELLDENGKPLPREAYEVTLPSGKVVKGTLDGQGRAKEERLESGKCKVVFPRLHMESWSLE